MTPKLPNWMTRGQRSLVQDALDAGYKVEVRSGENPVRIYRGSFRNGTAYGIDLWEVGTAIRCDVDPSIALAIRTLKLMREVLKLHGKT